MFSLFATSPSGSGARRGCGSVGRASPCQGEGRGFESRHPLGRLAQRERASLTRKRSLVRSQYRPLSFRFLRTRRRISTDRITISRGCGSVGRASPCQGEGRGFESRHPLVESGLPRGSGENMVGWPRGEAAACKAVYTGSNPVPTSGDWRRGSALPSHGRGHWFDPSIAHQRETRSHRFRVFLSF